MRVLVRVFLALSALYLLQTASFAATLMVAGSGMFSGTAPTTTFSAAGAMWSFSFNVSDVPVITTSTPNGFDIPFTNFTYHLAGGTVATTPARIHFFTSGFLGLFNIDIVDTLSPPDGNPVTGFEFSDGQAFSGTTGNPTILTGSYPATSANFISGGGLADNFSGVTVTITGTGTPEPATLAMAGIACCLFGWMRHRQRVRN